MTELPASALFFSALAKSMVVMIAASLLVLFVFASQFGMASDLGLSASVMAASMQFSEYLFEFVSIIFLVLLSFGESKWAKFLRYLLIPIVLIIWILQTTSLWFSNQHISPLVVDNAGAAQTIVSKSSLLDMAVISLAIIVSYLILRRLLAILVQPNLAATVMAAAAMILVSAGLVLASNNSEQLNPRPAPLHSTGVLALYYLGSGKTELESKSVGDLPSGNLQRYGFSLDVDAQYPLQKQAFYESELPFSSQLKERGPDIIVFFVEALSTRKLPAYGAVHEGLTPNIDRFVAESMRVDNYFNHTQSTFRGIKGQLCSSYPVHTTKPKEWANPDFQPPSIRYKCLPHHLNEQGYNTVFLGPDEKDHMHFEYQTRSVGFEKNYYREYMRSTFLNNEPLHGSFLTDVQLSRALLDVLATEPSNKPLFIASYFKDSHVGQDSKADGLRYGDGSNRILNTLHTFDAVFGKFWDEFKASERYTNSIVILTSDHAHWPERPYINIAGDDFNQTPVDKIALVVHSPLLNMPASMNANNATSLAFAPTMAHLLGFEPATNYFLGRSLFDDNQPTHPIAWFNNAIFPISREGGVERLNVRQTLPDDVARAWSAISLTHELELSDAIQPKQLIP